MRREPAASGGQRSVTVLANGKAAPSKGRSAMVQVVAVHRKGDQPSSASLEAPPNASAGPSQGHSQPASATAVVHQHDNAQASSQGQAPRPAPISTVNATPTHAGGVPGSADKGKHGGLHGRSNLFSLEFLIRVLLVLVLVELLAAILFEWSHRRWINVDFSRPLPALPEQRRTPIGRMFVGFPHLMRPYFCHPSGVKGRICALTILALGLLGLFFSYVHNMWQKEWWDLFNKADAKRFPELMGCYALLVIAWILNSVYVGYVRSWLYIDWREFMTWQFMQRWLASHSHFLIQLSRGGQGQKRVDNPEQRLQEDIHLFIENALSIIPEFLASAGSLCVFVPVVLWLEPEKAFGVVRCPGWLLYLAILYSFVGSMATHVIGWPMVNFSFAKQRYEADFRHAALHVRDQAESVALYSSEATEEVSLRQQFERIKMVQWRQMIITKRLTFFTSAYGFVQFLVPFFILAPSYFRRDLSLGDLFQLTGALGNVANSTDWFLRVYGTLTNWRATADRLISFEAAIACVQVQATHCASSLKQPLSGGGESALLQAEIKEVRLPDGEVLWKDIHLELQRGQRALISGPEGVGKSILFKALAGVWPHVDGCSVRLPIDDPSQVLFVPQRPALPKRCSLGQALAYPELRGAYSDEAMLRALRDVHLEHLVLEASPDSDGGSSGAAQSVDSCPEPAPEPLAEAAVGADGPVAALPVGLDRVEDWSSRLSPGQQQRLAMGHVLLRRPAVLFMDEATASVGKEGAAELISTVLRQLPRDAVVISISHDVGVLEPLHDVHFTACSAEEGDTAHCLQRLKCSGGDTKASASTPS